MTASRPLTAAASFLMPASVVDASANMRATSLAGWGKRRGAHTVGCSEQLILITAGMLSGCTSSTVTTSWGDWVIWHSARTDDWDTAELAFRRGPGSGYVANRGRPMWWTRKARRLESSTYRICT